MKYLLYFFGFLPSIIWLLFYLRKDKHPEPNRMVVKIFFFGILAALAAVLLERGFQKAHGLFTASTVTTSIFAIFFGGALIEECVKYGAARFGVFKSRELDEPTDIMLYMIIAALGFAALENILVLTNYHPILTSAKALEIMGWRFVSATFLHALCSGILGYFLALSFFHTSHRKKYFLAGLGISIGLHGFYNWSIMKVEGTAKFILPIIILIALSLFVSFGFKHLKRLKSTCDIQSKDVKLKQ